MMEKRPVINLNDYEVGKDKEWLKQHPGRQTGSITTAIELPVEIAKDMIKSRGYPDIDAQNAWDEWLLYKKTINS